MRPVSPKLQHLSQGYWLRNQGNCHPSGEWLLSSVVLCLGYSVLFGNTSTDVCNNTIPTIPPRVIENAIQVTLKLHFKWLWIDRYYIQQEETEKHEQIINMDLIYNNVYATIIAVVGEYPSFGLPRVSCNHTLASTLRSPRNLIRLILLSIFNTYR